MDHSIRQQIEAFLRAELPPDEHRLIPSLLAIMGELADGRAGAIREQIATDPKLAILSRLIERRPEAGALLDLSAAQTGDMSVRDIAGNNVINFNISPAATPGLEPFADGLAALNELMRAPAVRRVVAVFYADMVLAQQQVRDLIYLKTLHDLLHDLQYRFLPVLINEARRFPDDEAARAAIEDCEYNLSLVLQRIEELVAEGSIHAEEVRWRVRLGTATELLRRGLTDSDTTQITRSIRDINSVLATEPSFINASLYEKARSLRLNDLVHNLRQLHTRLTTLGVDSQLLSRVLAGVNGLDELREILSSLVLDHNSWQAVDRQLRRIEATLRLDCDELELSWADLWTQVDALCVGEQRWSVEIRTAGQRLATLIPHGDLRHVRQAFERFQNRVGQRFFQVDTNLKQLCDRLRDFRDPLNELEVSLQ